MNSKKYIYIFRHGQTDWNLNRRLQGHVDIALNETGRKQAEQLRDYFQKNPVDVFLSSDLSRARETAEIAAGQSGAEIIIFPELRERGYGIAEGLTHQEAEALLMQEIGVTWTSDEEVSLQHRFPGGETKAEHCERLVKVLESYLRTTEHSRIGVATHGGSLKRLFHHLHPGEAANFPITNCILYEFVFDPASGQWTLDFNPKCQ